VISAPCTERRIGALATASIERCSRRPTLHRAGGIRRALHGWTRYSDVLCTSIGLVSRPVDGADAAVPSGGAGKGIVADLGVMTALGTAAWAAAVVVLYPAYRGYYRELGIPLSRTGVDTTFMLARAGAVALLVVVCGTLLLVVAASVVVIARRRRLSASNVRTVIRRAAVPVAVGVLVFFVPSVLWTWWSAEALGEEVVRTGDAPSDARVNRLLDLHTFAVVLSPLDGDPIGLCEQSWFATLVAEDEAGVRAAAAR
jgi:hypothetical protein